MPTEKGVAVDAMLTLNATAQVADQGLYVASKAAPTVRSKSVEVKIKNWKLEDLKKYNMELRKPGKRFKTIDMDLEEQTVRAEFFGAMYPVAEEYNEELNNVKQGVAAKAIDDALRTRELAFEEVAFKAGVYDLADIATFNLTSTTVDPVKVIRDAKKAVKTAGLIEPNAIAMSEDVFNAFLQNAFIEDKLSYNGVGGTDLRMITSENQLAQILGVRYIFVLKHPFSEVTRKLLIYYIDPVMPEDKPNTVLTVARDYAPSVNGAAGIGITKEFFDEYTDSYMIKSKGCFKTFIKTPSLGQLFTGITVA